MNGPKKDATKTGSSVNEAMVLVLIGVLTFFLSGEFHDRGISQKWVTTMVGTVAPFGLLLYGNRRSLWRWTLWVSFGICLLVHCVLIVLTFAYIFRNIERISILLWSPIMVVEFFVLLLAMAKLQKMLQGKRKEEPVR